MKPLYYIQLGDLFLFSSEIKALLSAPGCPREVDLKSLGKLFALRYVPSPDTLLARSRNCPGHHMVVDQYGLKVERFWNWKPETPTRLKEDELVGATGNYLRMQFGCRCAATFQWDCF